MLRLRTSACSVPLTLQTSRVPKSLLHTSRRTMNINDDNGSQGKALQQITSHQQYEAPPLDISKLKSSPLEQFSLWFEEAKKQGVPEPEGFSVATVNAETLTPSVRMVLLKQVDDKGFVFFTNYQSRKGKELGMSPDLDKKQGNRAAGAWYWKEMSRSVRIVGTAERLSEKESYEYYSTRPIGSQIGAHASPQSQVVQSRDELEGFVAQFEDKFGIERGSASRKAGDATDEGKTVPLPKTWGGVRIVPDEVEFWVGRQNRLHDRARYTRQGDKWTIDRLAP